MLHLSGISVAISTSACDAAFAAIDHVHANGGQVSFVASQAEFTPRNVQTREERVKLVYAVKVRITADSTYDLKPGIPADVSLR